VGERKSGVRTGQRKERIPQRGNTMCESRVPHTLPMTEGWGERAEPPEKPSQGAMAGIYPEAHKDTKGSVHVPHYKVLAPGVRRTRAGRSPGKRA
jgi:hypothetical protein